MKNTTLLWLLGFAVLGYFLLTRGKTGLAIPTTRNTQTATRPPTRFAGLLNIVPVNTQQDLGRAIQGGGQAVATVLDSVSRWFKPSSQTAAASSVATNAGNIANDRFISAWEADFQAELPAESYEWDTWSDYEYA